MLITNFITMTDNETINYPKVNFEGDSCFIDGKEVTDPYVVRRAYMFTLAPEIRLRDYRPRSQKSMSEEFITRPGDVFTVKSFYRQLLTNSIMVEVSNENTKEDFVMIFPNKTGSWSLFKSINETAGRRVMYQLDGQDPVPFENSTPYKIRFNN